VPDAILFASPDRHIQIANQRACELFGYDSESFRGVPVRQLYAQEEDWLTVSNDDYLTVDTVRSDKAFQYVRADGTEFWGEVIRVTVFHPDEGVRGHLGIIRDVTARLEAELEWEQMEAQLRQSQKMQAIGQLTGGIAHDFNNILASVIGYTKLARDRCVDDPNGKLARYLGEVTKASERARDLVSQMLTFSRGGTGESVALDLPPLVDDALNLMRSTMPASMSLKLETCDGLPKIALDAVQVQQLLMNLCINARDAMDGYGQVTLSLGVDVFEAVSCASCRDEFGGEMLTLRVTDTGDGVEPDLLNRLFEPFFSTKQVGAGSGMGLAMVHGIVHRHGGHISLDSTPGNGFSIGLHFPVIWSEPSTSPPEEEGSLYEFVGEGNHVIVVDDERAVRTYLSDLLSEYGFTVESFASGTSAAKRIEYIGKCPDLLITDQTMPGMTGDELIAQLRDRWPALPVILCTGHSESVTENDVLAWGNSGYLAKPIPISKLTWLLSTLLPDK